ncbi:MAG: periplasmic heavy metal sensor [Rhizobiales bacterium]|nr:periplasmic heavy metal sensor [Hyphomicrobiales bacterium]
MSDQNNGPAGTPSPASPPRRRWLWVVAIVSLAINLLIVGAVAGHFVRGHGGPGGWSAMRELRDIPRERRDALRETFRAARQELRPMRDEIREAWRGAITRLEAANVDEAAIRAAVADATAKELAARERMLPVVVRVAGQLQPQEKRLVARMLAGWMGRGEHRRRHGGWGRGSWRGDGD